MKTYIFSMLTLTLSLSTVCRANDAAYTKLRHLYETSKPMKLSQFPLQTDPTITKWKCSGTSQGDELESETSMPEKSQLIVVVQYARPAAGPEFPARPEIDKTVDTVLFWPLDGSGVHSGPTKADDLSFGTNYSMDQTNGVETGFDNDFGHVTTTFRTSKGLIVYKTECSPNSYYSTCQYGNEYNYCWKNSTDVKPGK